MPTGVQQQFQDFCPSKFSYSVTSNHYTIPIPYRTISFVELSIPTYYVDNVPFQQAEHLLIATQSLLEMQHLDTFEHNQGAT